MKIERLCIRPYFNFLALCARDNGTVWEHKKRPLYGHFWPLRAIFVIHVLICVVLDAPSDQEGWKGCGSLAWLRMRWVLGIKKPRRAAGVPGLAGLFYGFYSILRVFR